LYQDLGNVYYFALHDKEERERGEKKRNGRANWDEEIRARSRDCFGPRYISPRRTKKKKEEKTDDDKSHSTCSGGEQRKHDCTLKAYRAGGRKGGKGVLRVPSGHG